MSDSYGTLHKQDGASMLPCMPAFREWLRQRLFELQWTKADLERASGVDSSTIWRWLSAQPKVPTPANLRRIAGPLGVSYEELLAMCYPAGQSNRLIEADDIAGYKESFGNMLDGLPRVFWSPVIITITALAESLSTISVGPRMPPRGTDDLQKVVQRLLAQAG